MPPNEEKEPASKGISIRLPRDIYEKAVAAAEAENRSLSNYILHVLVQSIDESKSLSDEIRELRNAIFHQRGDDQMKLDLDISEGTLIDPPQIKQGSYKTETRISPLAAEGETLKDED